MPESNDASIRQDDTFGKLFEATPVPDHIEGFELKDPEKIHDVWPEGTDKAKEVSHPLTSSLTARSWNDSCIPNPEKNNSNSSHPSRKARSKIKRMPGSKNT